MNKLTINMLTILLILLSNMAGFIPIFAQNATHPASYVWIDETGEGRQVYTYFRNEFYLETNAGKAEINL